MNKKPKQLEIKEKSKTHSSNSVFAVMTENFNGLADIVDLNPTSNFYY